MLRYQTLFENLIQVTLPNITQSNWVISFIRPNRLLRRTSQRER